MLYCYSNDFAFYSNFPVRNHSEKSLGDYLTKLCLLVCYNQKCDTLTFSGHCLIQNYLLNSGGVGNWCKILLTLLNINTHSHQISPLVFLYPSNFPLYALFFSRIICNYTLTSEHATSSSWWFVTDTYIYILLLRC